jgi:single-stranded-DNA-specific exonuclease
MDGARDLRLNTYETKGHLSMGRKFHRWHAMSESIPVDPRDVARLVLQNRQHEPLETLEYGDHGLYAVVETVARAIEQGRRIALYADYDVDGTMSCVSWTWFLKAIGYRNFMHYIPCRFNEGYGLNLKAVERLIDEEKAELIITMDTGITANAEARLCKERGVDFICTDHHVIQPDKMPDCVILNPKLHPDGQYKELCGCGITFVLLRRLAGRFKVAPELWTDLLALAGMATICDVVTLNGVNHRLAKLGVAALAKSRRPVLRRLMEAAMSGKSGADEKDVGFRLGPRINAVGRLEHADLVIKAFVDEDPEPLIGLMDECNDRRKAIQKRIVEEARIQAAAQADAPILFLGGDWHQGVVGIAASKLAEEFWRPTWLFQRLVGPGGTSLCKGSARSIPGFDVTAAMVEAGAHFVKFGGHAAAGGFSFLPENEGRVFEALCAHAERRRAASPEMWESRITYDCALPRDLTTLDLAHALETLKPFGHGFEEPRFLIEGEVIGTDFYNDKQTGRPRHTAVRIRGAQGAQKLLFFNEVLEELRGARRARFVVSAAKDRWQGRESLTLYGHDFEL